MHSGGQPIKRVFPYKQEPPLSGKSQQYYSEIQKYLRKIYNAPAFSLNGVQKKEARILEMVPLEEGLAQEKTSVRQKLQGLLSAIGNFLNKRIPHFGTGGAVKV